MTDNIPQHVLGLFLLLHQNVDLSRQDQWRHICYIHQGLSQLLTFHQTSPTTG